MSKYKLQLFLDKIKPFFTILRVKFKRVTEFVYSINNNYFSAGLTAVFVGAFFMSVYFLDKDFGSRFAQQQQSTQTLEIYSLDTSEIEIPAQVPVEYKAIPIHIVDIKSNSTPPSIVYSKVGDTVQFNNLTTSDITIESVQGESLKLEIPQGTGASTSLYSTGIFYYKISDDRVGQIFVEE